MTRSTGGVFSSRYFGAREMKAALRKMEPGQRRYVIRLARSIVDRTDGEVGFYAALDAIATIGVQASERNWPYGRKSSKST